MKDNQSLSLSGKIAREKRTTPDSPRESSLESSSMVYTEAPRKLDSLKIIAITGPRPLPGPIPPVFRSCRASRDIGYLAVLVAPNIHNRGYMPTNASRKLRRGRVSGLKALCPPSANAADIYFVPRNASDPLFKMESRRRRGPAGVRDRARSFEEAQILARCYFSRDFRC